MEGEDVGTDTDLRHPTIRGSVDNFLENLALAVEGISRAFGRNCEVVLHDLRHPERSIVAIANQHVTGRRVGDPLIGGPIGDIGLQLLQDGDIPSVIGTYATHTRDGRVLRSASVCFRNGKGAPVAALCINLDLSEMRGAKRILDDLCEIDAKRTAPDGGREDDGGNRDVTRIIKSIVDEALAGMQKPVHSADKDDKMNAIKTMYERGLFLVKGGVDQAAQALGVSRFTIYNYLKELQYRHE